MQRYLPPEQFRYWFTYFLPDLATRREPMLLLLPAKVSDRADGQIAHLDGLNLSRAWRLRQLASALRCATGACCNPNSSSASETTLTTISFCSAIHAASFAGTRLLPTNESRSVSRKMLVDNVMKKPGQGGSKLHVLR